MTSHFSWFTDIFNNVFMIFCRCVVFGYYEFDSNGSYIFYLIRDNLITVSLAISFLIPLFYMIFRGLKNELD